MATSEEMMNIIEQQRYQKMREDLLKRNAAYAKPDWQKQMTQLPLEKEKAFMDWVKANKVPFNAQDKYPDYDMRGYYQSLQKGDAPKAAMNTTTKSLHYPDTYKTPYHESFSAESQWAASGAPTWKGNKLVAPSGEVVFEDKPRK
jgi:uncharacterized membrane protein YvbJ